MATATNIGRLLYSLEQGRAEEVEKVIEQANYYETDSWIYLDSEYGTYWVWDDERKEAASIQIEKAVLGDNVNHPAHYAHPSGVEVIEITKHESFLRGNIIKYVLRAPYKGNELEDMQKAAQYLSWEIERLQETASN